MGLSVPQSPTNACQPLLTGPVPKMHKVQRSNVEHMIDA